MKCGRCWNFELREGHRIPGKENAFALPLIIPAALLLILGAVTLMSRTTTSYLATTKQSDGQAARQAAESGMNRVLGALNPYTKLSTDPYLSFLLASRWVPNTGVTYVRDVPGDTQELKAGWRLTTMGRTDVQALLRQCGLSARGQHPSQLPPTDKQGYIDILSGALGPQGTGTKTQLRYRVTDYVAPTRPASTAAWPTECEEFTTLAGGSAQISVEGRVIRDGRLVARYTLTRSFDVQGWPLLNLPVTWLTSNPGRNPGPPTGLRIGGVRAGWGSNVNGVLTSNFKYKTFVRPYDSDSFETATDVKTVETGLPQCNQGGCPFIADDFPVEFKVAIAEIIPAGDADLPPYPFETDASLRPPGVTPFTIRASDSDYPYIAANNSNLDTNGDGLADECRFSETVNSKRPKEIRPNEIDCWIQDVFRLDSSNQGVSIGRASYDLASNTATLQFSSGRSPFKEGDKINVDIKSGNHKNLNGTDLTVTAVPRLDQIQFKPVTALDADLSDAATPNSTATSASPITLTVNTQSRPVNLIVLGNVGTSSDSVSIKHKVRDSPTQINFVHAISSTFNVRSNWNRLRLFGLRSTGAACAANQTFFIRPDVTASPNISDALNGQESSLAGSFVWLPQGALVYGDASSVLPTRLLSVWWVCNLTIGNPNSGMMLVSPLAGNPDAVEAFLPGGYFSGGLFTPDVRFPTYPSLQRIRSAF